MHMQPTTDPLMSIGLHAYYPESLEEQTIYDRQRIEAQQLEEFSQINLTHSDNEPELLALAQQANITSTEDTFIEALYTKLCEGTLTEADILSVPASSSSIIVWGISSSVPSQNIYANFQLQALPDSSPIIQAFVDVFNSKKPITTTQERPPALEVPRMIATFKTQPAQLLFLCDHAHEFPLQLPVFKVHVNDIAYPYPLSDGVLVHAQEFPQIKQIVTINHISTKVLSYFTTHRPHPDQNYLFFPYRFFLLMKHWKDLNNTVPRSLRLSIEDILQYTARSYTASQGTIVKT